MRSAFSLAVCALAWAVAASVDAFCASCSARVALASTDSIDERRPAISERSASTSPLVAQPASDSSAAEAIAGAAKIFLILSSVHALTMVEASGERPRGAGTTAGPARGSRADLDRRAELDA